MEITYQRIWEESGHGCASVPFVPPVWLWHPPFRILKIQAFKGNSDIWDGPVIAVGGCSRWMTDRSNLVRDRNGRRRRGKYVGVHGEGKTFIHSSLICKRVIQWKQFYFLLHGCPLCRAVKAKIQQWDKQKAYKTANEGWGWNRKRVNKKEPYLYTEMWNTIMYTVG